MLLAGLPASVAWWPIFPLDDDKLRCPCLSVVIPKDGLSSLVVNILAADVWIKNWSFSRVETTQPNHFPGIFALSRSLKGDDHIASVYQLPFISWKKILVCFLNVGHSILLVYEWHERRFGERKALGSDCATLGSARVKRKYTEHECLHECLVSGD